MGNNTLKKKVVVGMSGGVDSSVAAYLLKQEGYEVIGVTMQIWQEENLIEQNENSSCGAVSAIEDARRVAEILDIPYYVMNFRGCFREKVIDYFVDEYISGKTPNPCIACNRYVKWEALIDRAMELGADYVATGHYARIMQCQNGRYAICNSVTANKDQTYALYNLTQEQLRRTLMPVGSYSKEDIRSMAANLGLNVASKPDSMEICFVTDDDYAGFIENYRGYKSEEGNFIDMSGKVIGRHKGIIHYTVGQRKGLGLSLGEPGFVVELKPESNEVVIGRNEDILTTTVYADRLNFMAVDKIYDGMEAFAKIRYNHRGASCRLYMQDENTLKCVFEEKQRAATPGQALVLYEGDVVLGGGTIIKR